MSDIILTFGKHKGEKLSQVPADYCVWLADNAYNAGVKRAARERLAIQKPVSGDRYTNAWHQFYCSEDEIEEARKLDRIQTQEDEEEAEKCRLEWTTDSGHEIIVQYKLDDTNPWTPTLYLICIDGKWQSPARDILPYTNPAFPNVAAKVGNVGLTAERRDALLAMVF
jgi:hypothetical protein